MSSPDLKLVAILIRAFKGLVAELRRYEEDSGRWSKEDKEKIEPTTKHN